MKKNVVLTGGGIILGVAIVAGGLWYWNFMKTHGPQPPGFVPREAVRVVEVSTTRWRPLSDLVGTVISIESVTISNEVPGTVTAVEFQSGAIVEQGQVILTLDASTEEAELRAAEASIRVSEAAYQSMLASERLARANYERVKQAAEAKAAAAMDVDERRSAADTAKADSDRMAAQIEQAKALADRVRTVISKKTIHAPFRARAGLRNIHPGQYLKEGTEIVSLQSITDDIYLDFALPQEQAWRAKPGMVVVASSNVLGDKPVEVKVVALDSAANPDTRNVRVRTIVSNKDGVLRPGMFVQVSVPTGEETEQVVVPVTAVRRATFGDHVFVVAMEKPAPPPGMPAPQGAAEAPPGEGAAPPAGGGAASPSPGQELVPVARQRMVTVGPRIGENVIILSGLKPGERVAADGSFKLRDGAQITEAPPAGQPDKTVATH